MKTWRIFSIAMIVLMMLVMGTGTVFAQEEPPEADPEEDGKGQNPVVAYLADILETEEIDVDVEELHDDGIGLGNISKAIYIMTLAGEGMLEGFEGDIGSILEQAKEMGWGNFYKDLKWTDGEIHRGVGHGLGWMFKEFGKKDKDKEKPNQGKPDWAGGPPDHAKSKDKDKDKNK